MTRSLRAITRAPGAYLAALCAGIALISSGTAWCQSTPAAYEVYQLKHKSAAEIQKVLGELLRDQSPQADLVVDPKSNRLLLRGPAETQRMARQLIDWLDRPPATAAGGSGDRPQDGARGPVLPEGGTTTPSAFTGVRSSGNQTSVGARRQLPPQGGTTSPAVAGGTLVGLTHTRVERVETTLRELLGPRLSGCESRQPGISHYWVVGPSGPMGELVIDRQRNGLVLFGSESLTRQLAELAQALDAAASAEGQSVRILPLRSADPVKVHQACEAFRSGYREPASAHPNILPPKSPSGRPEPDHPASPSSKDQSRTALPGAVEQVAYLFQAAGEGAPSAAAGAQTPGTAAEPEPGERENLMQGVGVDVEVQTLPDLDVLIIRGRERDVEEMSRIVEELERLSALAEPMIEVYPLKHVSGERLGDLVKQVQEQLVGSRQGRVSITPLVKPNALLLIGWGEAVKAVKELIGKLDRPVEPGTQSQVFRLKYATATQVSTTIQAFFSRRGGLGSQVQATADTRTNSILVQASPSDMQEVELLVQRLDTDQSQALAHARIFKISNALATDLATTLQGAIDAARGRTPTEKSAALELLTVDAQGQRLLKSGILSDVEITPDPHTNTLIVSGPADSMELIAALIEQLDTPAAVAQIKVFRILNSDANAFVMMLRTLLPATTTAGPQLAGAEGETSLAPLRFAVEPRTNTIIATGSPGDLAIIEALLLRLDSERPEERVNKVYKLKNSPATEVSTAINNFLLSKRQVEQAAPGAISPYQQIESEVVVVPEPVSNSLIISATPRYFDEIEQLVQDLDAEPPQVVIQVLIAEVALDDTDEFGVELGLQDSLLFDRSVALNNLLVPGFNFNNLPLGSADTATSLATRENVAGQALTSFSLGRTNSDLGYGGLVLSASNESVSVLIRALKECKRLDVLSRPQVMTLDNQSAFIQVGKRVPRISTSTINSWGQSNSVVLENVGLILGVTPRISPEGIVVMEIDAEKSELDPTQGIPVSFSGDNTITSPVINLTTAQTTVSAADGQTVVLGGMISRSTARTERRVPYLADVPVLGYLFRFDGHKANRTELLIILTPHVVRNSEDADRVKRVEAARMDWCLADVYDVHGPIGLRHEAVVYPDTNPRGVIPAPGEPEPLDHIPLPEPSPKGGQSGLPAERVPATFETSGPEAVQPAALTTDGPPAHPPYAEPDPRFRRQP